MRRWTAIAAALSVSVCPLAAQANARESLVTADRELSEATFTGGLTVLAAVAGPDGVVLWPGIPAIVGGVAATQFFGRQPVMSMSRFSWQPLRVEISPDSSLGFVIGVATMDKPGVDSIPGIHRIGRYLAAWKRVSGKWRLAAFAVINLVSTAEIMHRQTDIETDLPFLPSSGPGGRFIGADSMFSADAGTIGTAKAFAKWAAPDAMTFAYSGELNVGPAKIGDVFAKNTARWQWGAAAAGASADGMLGWTVGLATITSTKGVVTKSKYLTLWRKLPNGTIRFIADGGNARF